MRPQDQRKINLTERFYCHRCKKFHRRGSDNYDDHKSYIKTRNQSLDQFERVS